MFAASVLPAGEPPPALCGGAWLGFTIDDSWTEPGVRIGEPAADGPAQRAGLRAGDLVTRIAGESVHSAADLASRLARALPGDRVEFEIRRGTDTTRVELELWAVPRPVCLLRLGRHYWTQGEPATAAQHLRAALAADPHMDAARALLAQIESAQSPAGTPGAGRPDGLKAVVAVGGFEVKAAKANGVIGDSLREMLISELHESGYFIVVERDDLRGVMAEGDLSRSALAPTGAALPERMEVADIMVFGAVTEFEPKAGGSSWATPVMGAPLAIGTKISWAQMALDIRVVDVRSARVLGALRIPGVARSVQGTVGGALPLGPVGVPAGLGVYRGTPMEIAIRDCLHKSAYFVVNSIDEHYFHNR